jgi:hypothetical protein
MMKQSVMKQSVVLSGGGLFGIGRNGARRHLAAKLAFLPAALVLCKAVQFY